MDLSQRTLDLSLMYVRQDPLQRVFISGDQAAPYAAEFSTLLLSLQWAYEEICDVLTIAPHDLVVSRFHHPNSIISLQGLGDAITALRDLIMAAPALIVSLWTIPDRVKERRAEIRANTEYHEVLREVLLEYRNVPENQRQEYLRRALTYRFAGAETIARPREPWRLVDAAIRTEEIQEKQAATQEPLQQIGT
jgi:hypothetical protein